ncbi:hypothetical protein CDAR_586541 [Caerostris darwini]|uniref:Uncharacterized protein n=1 Tax=Caerostris darwini TaxID=1538125 RepID=A0AAV4Q9E1_9ARAC|nr:hypothetical protein CDAR_586541 [Caerostris darwini]
MIPQRTPDVKINRTNRLLDKVVVEVMNQFCQTSQPRFVLEAIWRVSLPPPLGTSQSPPHHHHVTNDSGPSIPPLCFQSVRHTDGISFRNISWKNDIWIHIWRGRFIHLFLSVLLLSFVCAVGDLLRYICIRIC